MTAAKRYESVWNAFLNEQPHNPTATLTSFLKRCNVRQGRMKRWMENNGLSVKEAKKRLRDCQHDGIGDPIYIMRSNVQPNPNPAATEATTAI